MDGHHPDPDACILTRATTTQRRRPPPLSLATTGELRAGRPKAAGARRARAGRPTRRRVRHRPERHGRDRGDQDVVAALRQVPRACACARAPRARSLARAGRSPAGRSKGPLLGDDSVVGLSCETGATILSHPLRGGPATRHISCHARQASSSRASASSASTAPTRRGSATTRSSRSSRPVGGCLWVVVVGGRDDDSVAHIRIWYLNY